MRRQELVCLAILATALPAATAAADPIADFYKGKEMQMIIRTTAGGGYDIYARLLARHIVNHIPGKPTTMIPVNMPGGGGIKAANYVAQVAPKDGTVMTIVSQGLPMYQALDLGKKLKADMRAFNWIGNMSDSNQIIVTWHTSPTKTLADAKARTTVIGSTGAGSISTQLPAVYNNVLGTKFKIVFGYISGSEVNLAMERGEVEGRGTNTWASYVASNSDYIKNHKLNYLIQVGLKKEKDLPNVPLLRDLATDADDKAVLDFVSKAVAVGRPIAVGPGVPKARVKALRAAYEATIRDPAFIADSKRIKAEISSMSGEDLQQLVSDLIDAPQRIRDKVKNAIQPKDAEKLATKAKKKKG
jgi:tripartite-type tricarboxylate transporter receptor subunit TctC